MELNTVNPRPAPKALDREALGAFWEMADSERLLAEYKVDRDLAYLRTASAESLKTIFAQYRFFTLHYIDDLRVLVSRLPKSRLLSTLTHILEEELGEGNPVNAHPQLYDSFLRSIGISSPETKRALPENAQVLSRISGMMTSRSTGFGIGLRGMGGECLCQVYLAAMHTHFIQNPFILASKARIDWRFWDIHTGPTDVEHRRITRLAIDDYLEAYPESATEFTQGYLYSKKAWDDFWAAIFKNGKSVAGTC